MIKSISSFVALLTIISAQSQHAFAADAEVVSLNKYQGYPLCEDVISQYSKSKLEILLSQNPDLKGLDIEFNLSIPNSKIEELSDTKSVSNSFQRAHSGMHCFKEDTIVTGLIKSSNEWIKKDIPIKDLPNRNYVLSSTKDMLENPAYQVDCWDRVVDVLIGNVESGEDYREIQFTNTKTKESYTLSVTPKHNFYCADSSAKGCEWKRAESIGVNALLISGCNGETCSVSVASDKKGAFGTYLGWGSRDLIGGEFSVYNFTTARTHVYYVGPETNRVLVHNAK